MGITSFNNIKNIWEAVTKLPEKYYYQTKHLSKHQSEFRSQDSTIEQVYYIASLIHHSLG